MIKRFLRWFFKAELSKHYNEMIELAEKAKESAQRRNYTTLEKIEIDTEAYYRQLKNIWESPAFQYERLNVMGAVSMKLIEGKQDCAVTIQGMFKGIDLVVSAIQAGAIKYQQIQDEKNAKIQNQGTQTEAD